MSEQRECVVMSRSGDCVDLRATFGGHFKIVRDESYYAERPEFRGFPKSNDSWVSARRIGHEVSGAAPLVPLLCRWRANSLDAARRHPRCYGVMRAGGPESCMRFPKW